MTAIRTQRPRGFRVTGEIDISNEGALSRLLASETAEGGDLTLDLTELAFIDSSGVRALISAAGKLSGRGRLVLTGMRPPVARMFALMGVDRAPGVVVGEPLPTQAGPPLPDGTRTRADAAGKYHPVKESICACGCPYLYAADDLALFWEPGRRYNSACRDRACQCHVAPLRG